MRLVGWLPRKYFSHIFLSITLSSILTVIVLSIVIYFNATHILRQKEYASTVKSLAQVKYNLNQMDNEIKSLTNYLFLNNEIRSIMYSREEPSDMVDLIIKVNRLTGAILSSNQFIDSVGIYNNYIDEYFYIGRALYFEDTVLQETINANTFIPRLKPIFRNIELSNGGGIGFENVITYFMYDNTDGFNRLDGSIILNVNYKWFMDNVNMINMTDRNLNDQVLILDENQQYINDDPYDSNFKKSLREAYLKNINLSPDGRNQGFFESKLGNTDFFVTYLFVDNIGYTLLKIQKSSEVYRHIQSLKKTILWVTTLFLLMIFLVSLMVSRSIYRPISNLLKQFIKTNGNYTNDANLKDEISYIGDSYREMLANLEVLRKEQDQNNHKMKRFWINKLLISSYNLSEQEFKELTKDRSMMKLLEHDIYICLIKIDYYNKFQTLYNERHQQLLKFAILNISTEILYGQFDVDGTDMNDDNVTLIIGVKPGLSNVLDTIVEALKQAQIYIYQHYKISFTATVSEKTKLIAEISKVYNNTLDRSLNRFVLGRMSVITPGEKKLDDGSNFLYDYPNALEDKLMENIKLGKSDEFEVQLQSFFNAITPLEYDYIIISLVRLTDRLKRTLDVVSTSKIEPVNFDFPKISQRLFGLETIEDGFNLILESVKEILDKDSDDALQARNSAIIETVSDFISENYYRPNLCQDEIATINKISTRRLSRIFRDGMQMSIPEYINEFRLNKAKEWLEMTELSVHQVITKVGFENETYFYTIFKKRFGITPKEYALQKKIHSEKTI